MAIKLWGRASSANVQKVRWTLAELGLPYDHVEIGGRFGGNDTPEYLAVNPNGLVPTLTDGELVLWESHAIVRYLAAQYGAGTLWPQNPVTRAEADRWTDRTATTFQPAWIGVFWKFYRTPAAERDEAAIAAAIAATERCFGIMDARLAASPYLGGDRLTYADIVAGTAMYRWRTMGIERKTHGKVERWADRFTGSEIYRNTVAIDYSELAGRTAA